MLILNKRTQCPTTDSAALACDERKRNHLIQAGHVPHRSVPKNHEFPPC